MEECEEKYVNKDVQEVRNWYTVNLMHKYEGQFCNTKILQLLQDFHICSRGIKNSMKVTIKESTESKQSLISKQSSKGHKNVELDLSYKNLDLLGLEKIVAKHNRQEKISRENNQTIRQVGNEEKQERDTLLKEDCWYFKDQFTSLENLLNLTVSNVRPFLQMNNILRYYNKNVERKHFYCKDDDRKGAETSLKLWLLVNNSVYEKRHLINNGWHKGNYFPDFMSQTHMYLTKARVVKVLELFLSGITIENFKSARKDIKRIRNKGNCYICRYKVDDSELVYYVFNRQIVHLDCINKGYDFDYYGSRNSSEKYAYLNLKEIISNFIYSRLN